MLIQCEFSKQLKTFLEDDLIGNLNIIGIIENDKNAKIFTDDINLPTGIVVNSGYFNYIYTQNDSFIDKVLYKLDNIKGEFGFSAVNSYIATKLKEKYKITWENECILYYYDKKTIDTSFINRNTKEISIKDAHIVNDYYTYKSEDSIDNIKDSIEKRINSAVYINNELAAWLLIHEDNSLGPMYTKENFRNKGYAVDTTLDVVNKFIKVNKIPFLHIAKDNATSHKLALKCGFEPYCKVHWLGIII